MVQWEQRNIARRHSRGIPATLSLSLLPPAGGDWRRSLATYCYYFGHLLLVPTVAGQWTPLKWFFHNSTLSKKSVVQTPVRAKSKHLKQ